MRGYVKLNPNIDIDMFSKAMEVIEDFTPEIAEVKKFNIWKLKHETRRCHKDTPYWYEGSDAIYKELEQLIYLLRIGVYIQLPLLSYNEIVKLSKGDFKSNPYHILALNYY